MRKLIATAFVVAVLIAANWSAVFAQDARPTVDWVTDFDAALTTAAIGDAHVLVDFYTDW